MYEVRIETHFCAAHFLENYHGKCESLHGHNYKVFATVAGDTLDSGGMLIDFGILKNKVNCVVDTLDHKCLNDIEYFCNNPSAERIAKYIFDKVTESGISNLKAVEVYETEKNRAMYYK